MILLRSETVKRVESLAKYSVVITGRSLKTLTKAILIKAHNCFIFGSFEIVSNSSVDSKDILGFLKKLPFKLILISSGSIPRRLRRSFPYASLKLV